MYKECSSCKESFSKDEINQIGNTYYCNECINVFFKPITQKEQISKQFKNRKILLKLSLCILFTLFVTICAASLINIDWAVPYILIVLNIPFYYVSFKVFFPNIEALKFSITYLVNHIKEATPSTIPARVRIYLGLLIVFLFLNTVVYYFEKLIVSIFLIFF